MTINDRTKIPICQWRGEEKTKVATTTTSRNVETRKAWQSLAIRIISIDLDKPFICFALCESLNGFLMPDD
jgi:hypothetical protein